MAKAHTATGVNKAGDTQVVRGNWAVDFARQSQEFFGAEDLPGNAMCLGELYELCKPPITPRNFMQRLSRLVSKGVLQSRMSYRRGRQQRVYWPTDPTKPVKFF